jgi:aminobenzoyl-glutamate utilization protein B
VSDGHRRQSRTGRVGFSVTRYRVGRPAEASLMRLLLHAAPGVRIAVTMMPVAILVVGLDAQRPSAGTGQPSAAANARLEALKTEALAQVDAMNVFTGQVVDTIFSFGELGFQEMETHRYLVAMLRSNGFEVEEAIAGIPTAFMASWGSGKPVIALGSDIDGIPQASQKPGVAYHDPLVAGAPGHGEGHNSGQAVNITAALVVKKLMEREKLPGTLRIWPGTAEELVGTKAYFVRAGYMKDVDLALFSHVGNNLSTSWGSGPGNGLVSVEYTFRGEGAHSAGAPWRGRSALDAVELMNIGWNYRREHLRIQQRSHYVITDGGDQPNVVPSTASVWYYFRETDYVRIKQLWEMGDQLAQGAALMTGTRLEATRVLGSAWPQHMNKPMAEVTYQNIQRVGLPKWSHADQVLAKATQREVGVEPTGLALELDKMEEPLKDEDKRGGGSDDIGDISWNVPTITLRYPSNIPNLPGHHWSNAISMATPIAHKGASAGAKVYALTMLDILLRPTIVEDAWGYFKNVQTRDVKYDPLIRPQDEPAIWLNREVMEKYRPAMRRFYFDPTRYKTYLEQLGITYPTVRSENAGF